MLPHQGFQIGFGSTALLPRVPQEKFENWHISVGLCLMSV